MEPRANNQPACDVCQDHHNERRVQRREFLTAASGLAIGATVIGSVVPAGRIFAEAKSAAEPAAATSSPETLVKVLFDTLSPKQRENICFDWEHQDKERGLLRTRVANNWDITEYNVNDNTFYTKDQQKIIRGIYEGIINPEWHSRIDKQLADDSGGYGENNSIAIFGTPGGDKFEFVMTGRHMTIRCDGNSADHVAFGGPIFYGHAAETFNESANHKGNIFWPQALAANELYKMLDSKQQKQALLAERPAGRTKSRLPRQRRRLPRHAGQRTRRATRKTICKKSWRCLSSRIAKAIATKSPSASKPKAASIIATSPTTPQGDIGEDKVWDNWRIEGPSFVWHYRGAPHVHVWVNVADDPSVKLNA